MALLDLEPKYSRLFSKVKCVKSTLVFEFCPNGIWNLGGNNISCNISMERFWWVESRSIIFKNCELACRSDGGSRIKKSPFYGEKVHKTSFKEYFHLDILLHMLPKFWPIF